MLIMLTIFSLITSSTNGFDGSMMNGLQSLKRWQTDFNNPSNSMLGLLNAIQVSTDRLSLSLPSYTLTTSLAPNRTSVL